MYVFGPSAGKQPTDVGTITLTQINANSVGVFVDLINTPLPSPLSPNGYGFLNTGGPHTPFAFNLAGSGALSISFTTPTAGIYSMGVFSLNTAGGKNTPYDFGVAIDDSAGNGSGKAYYGDLLFTLTRVGGLSTDDFVANSDGVYFSADLTDGRNTAAQFWRDRVDPPSDPQDPPAKVPEPLTMSLFGAGLAGMIASRRRKAKTA